MHTDTHKCIWRNKLVYCTDNQDDLTGGKTIAGAALRGMTCIPDRYAVSSGKSNEKCSTHTGRQADTWRLVVPNGANLRAIILQIPAITIYNNNNRQFPHFSAKGAFINDVMYA